MDLEFLSPVNPDLLEEFSGGNSQTLRNNLEIHTERAGLPDLENVQIALVGVKENRLNEEGESQLHFDKIRRAFYNLYPGNWHLNIVDLGDIEKGESVEDTYYALQNLISDLVKKDILPVILGGGQDLIYAQYRAYDTLDQMVNLVNIDHRFDLGDAEQPISNHSFVGKIVVNQPYNLFNYSNLGYQTYFNSQDEIELMDRLFFDAYRVGEIVNDISLVEPVMRDANLVDIDLGAFNSAVLGAGNEPHGFDGREICALSRSAGISDKV